MQTSPSPSALPTLAKWAAVALLVTATSFFGSGCSATKKDPNQPQPSDDILELLTGFGESISQRDFQRAVGYLTPEERSLMLDAGGKVPADKQRALAALPLQRLIRAQGVRVEGGYLAGIYDQLPVLRPVDELMAEASASNDSVGFAEESPATDGAAETTGTAGADYDDLLDGNAGESLASAGPSDASQPSAEEKALKSAVQDFFRALDQKRYQEALSLVNENEKAIFFDDRGRLKESAKQRLERIDQRQTSRSALLLRDGKLTGVTLLLPPE